MLTSGACGTCVTSARRLRRDLSIRRSRCRKNMFTNRSCRCSLWPCPIPFRPAFPLLRPAFWKPRCWPPVAVILRRELPSRSRNSGPACPPRSRPTSPPPRPAHPPLSLLLRLARPSRDAGQRRRGAPERSQLTFCFCGAWARYRHAGIIRAPRITGKAASAPEQKRRRKRAAQVQGGNVQGRADAVPSDRRSIQGQILPKRKRLALRQSSFG